MNQNIIEDILINNFPDDTISCTAKSSMESDFNIDLNNNISGMIEIKCYNKPVNQNEIDKFIRDLTVSKKQFGIFASITKSP